jgi:hypothetical protein
MIDSLKQMGNSTFLQAFIFSRVESSNGETSTIVLVKQTTEIGDIGYGFWLYDKLIS